MGQFGEERPGNKSVTRHDIFYGSPVYVLFKKKLGLALELRFRVTAWDLALGQTNILCNLTFEVQ